VGKEATDEKKENKMITRKPTAQEKSVFRDFERRVIDGRKTIEGFLGACACLSMIEEWRQKAVKKGLIAGGFLPPVFTAGTVKKCKKYTERWNKLEKALSDLQSDQAGFQVVRTPEGKLDLNVIEYEQEKVSGLGAFPLYVVVAGVILITFAISYVMKLRYDNQEKARKMKLKITKIDQEMAKAPPGARSSYERMKKTPEYTQKAGLLDRVSQGFGALAGLALAVLGVMAFSAFTEKRKQNPIYEWPLFLHYIPGKK
jgi:hypothetical protein